MTVDTTKLRILLADDDADDRLLFTDAMQELGLCGSVEEVVDGVELMARLRADLEVNNELPDLVLLDLNMPRKSGSECLVEIRADHRLRHLVVVVFSTSKAKADIVNAYRLGANSFINKPMDYAATLKLVSALYGYWLGLNQPPLAGDKEFS